jgi:Formyl transferase
VVERKPQADFPPAQRLALDSSRRARVSRGVGRARANVVVSVSWPQIFEKRLIDLPPKGCLNVHGGILPNYRDGREVGTRRRRGRGSCGRARPRRRLRARGASGPRGRAHRISRPARRASSVPGRRVQPRVRRGPVGRTAPTTPPTVPDPLARGPRRLPEAGELRKVNSRSSPAS